MGAARQPRPCGREAEGQRAGPVHPGRAHRAQCRLSRPLGRDRGAASDRPHGARAARGSRLRGRDGRRAVDELLRRPGGSGAARRRVQPDSGTGGRALLPRHAPVLRQLQGRAVAKRRYAPMFPAFLKLVAHELHLEMASREFAELELIQAVGEEHDVGVGVIDVKSYYVETSTDVEERIRACLCYVAPERLSVSPDCGLSQTARWAAQRKLTNMVEGARLVRESL